MNLKSHLYRVAGKLFDNIPQNREFIYQICKRYVKMCPSHLYLALIKRDQKSTFEVLKGKCSQYYNDLRTQDISDFITPLWEDYNKEIEKVILPYPLFSFLRNRSIMKSMFVAAGGKWINEELAFLEKSLPTKRLRTILQEDYVGKPILMNSTYLTSHSSIHIFYHLLKFQDKARINLSQLGTVVEWGGGYGNMAKLFRRVNTKATYIIIDTPLFSCIQWLYLATVFGDSAVNILHSIESRIEREKINLLPVCFLKCHDLNADVFIATWSLSESSKSAQDYVSSLNFFDAKHLLLAYQESSHQLPDAGRLGDIAVTHGAVIEPIEFLPGNYYAFK